MRKEYTDKEFIGKIHDRWMRDEKIKHSEYLMLWLNRLLTARSYDITGVMYRMKKRYGEDTTFEQAVEWLDRDIRQAEAEGN